MTALLHIGAVGISNLRFFVPPRMPDFPWVALDDLCRAMALSRDVRRALLQRTRQECPQARTVATDSGATLIAPHYAAQAIIGAMVEVGEVQDSFWPGYTHAGAEALAKLTAGMSRDELMAFTAEVMRRADGGCA